MSTHTQPNPTVAPRVLVTGGAGFIGSHLVQSLLASGAEVVIIDDLSTGQRDNVPTHDNVRFLHGTVEDVLPQLEHRDPQFTQRGYDAIYHLAAAVGVELIIDEPIRTIETNIVETAQLLRFALTARRTSNGNAPCQTLIASTSEVYGKSEAIPFREDDDVVYGPTTKHRWSYACTKAIDEYLALAYFAKHDLPVVVTRFFNTVGPRQTGRYGMVLPRFVQAAQRGGPLPIHGTGEQTRCFCDVRDVVPAIRALMADPAHAGRIYNIGSDSPISIQDLASRVIAIAGPGATTERIPYDRAYGDGFEDLKHRRPDLTRITDAIGFAPTISLDQTISDIAQDTSAQQSPSTELQS